MNTSLNEVAFSYERRRRKSRPADLTLILKQVKLDIPSGEMLAVAGKSGSGKSTFMQLIKGFLKPTFGQILLENTDPYGAKRPELFDRVGFIFQYPEHQLFSSTVEEDIAFGLRQSPYTPEEKQAKVKRAMESVGLDYETFASRSPFELSGGEKRRVAIAGVVVLEPELIILDEPTAGLDYPSRTALFEMLHGLNAEQGTTILWVSHQLEEILEHASRVLVLKEGDFIADGPPRQVLSDRSLLGAMGWELPAALALAELLAETHGVSLDRPWDLREVVPELIRLCGRKQPSAKGESPWLQ
ncbi:ATP-binding cassette domain-containing protein [Paenibacillus filicis]|uniref:ATP-binding cassette domain-containing protein n=1 Tax=Paenibacillus filicis TaxID=669464 RepID=A0ABU9DQN1_9BACL